MAGAIFSFTICQDIQDGVQDGDRYTKMVISQLPHCLLLQFLQTLLMH